MNKIFLFVILLFSNLATTQAIDVQGRVAYFIPQNHNVRSFYAKGLPEYEVEISAPMNSFSCLNTCDEDWAAWTNFSIYQKKGRDSCQQYSSKLTNWALNFCVKRYFSGCMPCAFDNLRPYLGFGIGFAHLKLNNHSCYECSGNNHNGKYGFALLAKFGFEYQVTCNLFLDFFADYSGNWFKSNRSQDCISTRCVNTGGLKLGAGLGYRF